MYLVHIHVTNRYLFYKFVRSSIPSIDIGEEEEEEDLDVFATQDDLDRDIDGKDSFPDEPLQGFPDETSLPLKRGAGLIRQATLDSQEGLIQSQTVKHKDDDIVPANFRVTSQRPPLFLPPINRNPAFNASNPNPPPFVLRTQSPSPEGSVKGGSLFRVRSASDPGKRRRTRTGVLGSESQLARRGFVRQGNKIRYSTGHHRQPERLLEYSQNYNVSLRKREDDSLNNSLTNFDGSLSNVNSISQNDRLESFKGSLIQKDDNDGFRGSLVNIESQPESFRGSLIKKERSEREFAAASGPNRLLIREPSELNSRDFYPRDYVSIGDQLYNVLMAGYVLGPPRSDIYDDHSSRSKLISEIPATPPERPSWGFRKPGEEEYEYEEVKSKRRYDDTHNNGESDDDNDGSPRRGRGLLKAVPNSKDFRVTSRQSSISQKARERSRAREGVEDFRATRVTLHKNGDAWFGSMEFRFILGKEIKNLDDFFARANDKMNFVNGISYMFDTQGSRITSIEQIENLGSYVMSSGKKFVPGNYGKTGMDFEVDGGVARKKKANKRLGAVRPANNKPASPESGRTIKIISAQNQKLSEKVLLNLKTNQSFEDVIKDLGQVLKIRRADRLYSRMGKEIKSFSQLKMEHLNETTFFISSGHARISGYISDTSSENDDVGNESDGGSSSYISLSKPELSIKSESIGRALPRAQLLAKDDLDAAHPEAIKIKVGRETKVVYPPTVNGDHGKNREPTEQMELDWVYGYKGQSEKRNLWFVNDEEILYYVGSIAVIYNRITESQKHYTEHTESIQCMDMHPSMEYVASGQTKGNSTESWAHIRIWHIISLETKVTLGIGECTRGINAVAFSTLDKGNLIMCVDQGKDNEMSIWDWKKNELVGRSATDNELTNGCAFHPFDKNLTITYGKDHLVFWNRKKDGFFERSDIVKDNRHFNCHEFLESGDLVLGDTDGMIANYSVNDEGEYYLKTEFDAHKKGGVSCLLLYNGHTLMSGGDRDGMVVSWDAARDFEKLGEAPLPSDAGCARTIIPQKSSKNSPDQSVYVGTTENKIVEGSIYRTFKILVWGHVGAIQGLASHPDDLAFVTAGADKTIVKWRKQKVAWIMGINGVGLTASFHPSGIVAAVGTDDGHLVVLDGETGSHEVTIRACNVPLTSVSYSPDGDTLALAAESGSVYLYDVLEDGRSYKKRAKMAGKGDTLRHLDWSRDSTHIQTINTTHDLSYWNVRTAKVTKLIQDSQKKM